MLRPPVEPRKFITPHVENAGWDDATQIRREVHFTNGQIHVRRKMVTRGKSKFADYVLYYKPNIPIAIIEAKENNRPVGDGMQQALEYAEIPNIPFVFSSNGDGFVFHDRTGTLPEVETSLPLEGFPSPARLWAIYRGWKGLSADQGIGRALLDLATRPARGNGQRAVLDVVTDADGAPATALYERAGWTTAGNTTFHFRDG